MDKKSSWCWRSWRSRRPSSPRPGPSQRSGVKTATSSGPQNSVECLVASADTANDGALGAGRLAQEQCLAHSQRHGAVRSASTSAQTTLRYGSASVTDLRLIAIAAGMQLVASTVKQPQ